MTKNWLFRSLTVFVSLALVFATVGVGYAASPAKPVELAQIYGEFDFSSEELVTAIVELKAVSIVEAKHTGKSQSKANLKIARDQIINELPEQATVVREYDHVFSGIAISLPANAIPNLVGISGIKAVYPDVHYQTTQFGSDEAWETFNPNMLDSAPYIGSQDAWDAGFTGAGVTVAIIDTGVDYTHPDLAHAFGDYKGWDFVDNDNDPQETSVGDPDLNTSHGTHVAGTVAANGDIKGVAPDATLLAYRVLGPGGSGYTSDVIAGIEMAVEDGADIMNLSLGANVNNPDYATSIALDWAMAEGVVAVTSNGNSGPNNWTVGSPGTSREAISVGATQLPYNVYTAGIFTSGESYTSPEVMGFPSDDAITGLDGETYQFVHVGLGYPADFEELDLTGKVALISRGDIPFVEKSDNAKAAGAVATIIYNHLAGQIEHFVAGISLPTVKLSNADGQKMLADLEAENDEVTFTIDYSHRVDETVADFSSRGPVMDTWMIKPDVSAPGVGIVSTVPTHNPEDPHGYASYQGTSMSAPHVAGAAALMLQANPAWNVDFVKAALMNTAVDLYDENGNLYPHNSQGAGSIRVLDAINTKTLVTPGSHSFGVFYQEVNGNEVRRQSFSVHNLSNKRVRYSIEFIGHEGIKVQASNNLQVQPGKTQNLNFGVQVDSNLAPGYYEGTFVLSDGIQTVKVPTILFVGEPDYPTDPITGAYFGKNDDGTYYVGAGIPFGADILEYDIHYFTGAIGGYIDTIGSFANVPGPTHFFDWDGTVWGSDLPNGTYVLIIWVFKDGAWVYRAYLITKD